jgi:hypothetical protein
VPLRVAAFAFWLDQLIVVVLPGGTAEADALIEAVGAGRLR